uniref:Dynein, axonemal, light chain 4b n=1 Tax=Neogobius melanostomus TaxID=47308 RepID=A0A8C6WLR6_9GOBI
MGNTELTKWNIGKKEEADYKRMHSFPLIRHTDMPEEMRVETMELCVTACEKFATNNEVGGVPPTLFDGSCYCSFLMSEFFL